MIGLAAGVFGGLVGVGGGAVMIPMMVRWMKLSQHKAHGTSLVALVFTGMVGAAAYACSYHVDVWASMILAAAALWPARLGARCCRLLPEESLRRLFGFFLITMVGLILIKSFLLPLSVPAAVWYRVVILLVTGVCTGFLSGLMGIGGGPIMIAAMVLLAGYGQHVAQGSALLAMVPAGAVGAYTHWRFMNIEISLLKGLIPGIVLGTLLGSSVAQYLPDEVLKIVFVAILLWMGVRLIVKKTPSVCE